MITASAADKQAFAKIGGALDTLSDSFTYVSKTLSTAGDARDPLTDTSRMPGILKKAGQVQKVYSYARKIQEALDETKRDGALLKLGLKISMDIAAKLLGTSLTTHPYYAYHKAMIDALADALNASRNSRAAVDSYRRAVTAANSAGVASAFKRIESQKVEISASHISLAQSPIGVAADVARGMMSEALAREKIETYGRGKLLEAMADLEAWRAQWAGLCFDVLQLQIMTGNELNVAIQSMNRVKDLMNTLMGGSNTSRVAGYAAQNNIDWEKYDQIVNQNQPHLLLTDPVRFAQGNSDKAAAWAQAFAEMCDFARGERVLFPSEYNRQLSSLNKVLYG